MEGEGGGVCVRRGGGICTVVIESLLSVGEPPTLLGARSTVPG